MPRAGNAIRTKCKLFKRSTELFINIERDAAVIINNAYRGEDFFDDRLGVGRLIAAALRSIM